MSTNNKASVLIVGAGAIGIVLGYHLQLAGAEITYLIRPHRLSQLQNPQTLYSHDDNSLKVFKRYHYITEASQLLDKTYDYIFIALDGAALKSESGQELVRTIGKAAGGEETTTKVILGTFYFDIRSWFLQLSGLPASRVCSCNASIHVYSTKAFTMPTDSNSPGSSSLIKQADWAYADRFSTGAAFHTMDDCPEVAKSFSELYNGCQVSKCIIRSPVEDAIFGNVAPIAFAASELLGWPQFRDIDPNSDIWKLATDAAKEVMGLRLHGEAGANAAAYLQPAMFLEGMKQYEQAFGSFSIVAFSRYHHGGKVLAQDKQHIQDSILVGEKEGKSMQALKELVRRFEQS